MKSSLSRRRFVGASASVAAIAALGRNTFAQDDLPEITIGSQNHAEQFILAEMCGLLLEDVGFPVNYEHNLGGTVVLNEGAISGDLDLFVGYLGDGLIVLESEYSDIVDDGTPAEDAQGVVYEYVRDGYLENWNLRWLDPIGINNTYALAMRRDHAQELEVTTVSELEAHAAHLTLGGSQEFMIREDGLPGLEEAYGFEFEESSGMESGLMYSALESGEVDVISAFATDGRIPALDFVLLEDDLAFFPPYHASPVIRGELIDEYPDIEEVLNWMGGLIDNTIMAELNFRVDDGGEDPRDVARDFLTQEDLLEGDE